MRFTVENEALTVETSAPVTLTLWGKNLSVTGAQAFAYMDFMTSVTGTATTEGSHDA
ncbi:Uncharacterised protein [Leclercia adecarboxylata]|nr:Uncharacterised protein [Leclercia adecarboxylata]